MYMPTLARFTSRDPLPDNGSALFGGLASYMYVTNNPINRIDPSGLEPADRQNKDPCESFPCMHLEASSVVSGSCKVTILKKENCTGIKARFITEKKICEGLADKLAQENKEGEKDKGLIVECQKPCECQDKKKLDGMKGIEREYKGLPLPITEVSPKCVVTVDLSVKVDVGKGWEGTCCVPKQPVKPK